MSETQLPPHWKVVKLGDIALEVGSGITPRGGEKSYLQSGIPLIRSQNVLMNKLSLDDVAYISSVTHQRMMRSTVMIGDLLLNITGASIGRVTHVPQSIKIANVNQHVCRIRLRNDTSPEFVSYFLSSPRGQSQIMGSQFGTTRQGLNYGQVRALKFPLPPLPEQRAIAQALRSVQETKETRQRELTLERERKAAIMDYLFTHGMHGEAWKQTEIGEIPESWEVVRLGDVFETQLGKMLSQKAKVGKSPKLYLRNANVQWGRIDCNEIYEMDFDKNEQEKFRLEYRDILVCEGGEIGRTAIWRDEIEECYFQKAIHRLRPRCSSTILPEFFLYWMEKAFRLSNIYGVSGTETTIAHLPQQRLNVMKIPKPLLHVQEKITEILTICDTKITALERETTLLDELFQATLEELMTGRVSAIPLT